MLNKRQQNKIKTPGYFIKRLRDCKFGVLRVFQNYGIHDFRRWTVLVDPGGASVYVTCYNNKSFNNDVMFEFYDGGNFFPKNFSISTESIEVIVQLLIDRGIQQITTDNKFFKQKEHDGPEEQ
jgi:hypothetical protein